MYKVYIPYWVSNPRRPYSIKTRIKTRSICCPLGINPLKLADHIPLKQGLRQGIIVPIILPIVIGSQTIFH